MSRRKLRRTFSLGCETKSIVSKFLTRNKLSKSLGPYDQFSRGRYFDIFDTINKRSGTKQLDLKPYFTIPLELTHPFKENSRNIDDNSPKYEGKFTIKSSEISPLSNFLSLVDFLNRCDLKSVNTIRILALGHCQYFYKLLSEFFPSLTIEIWSEKKHPITENNKVKVYQGLPSTKNEDKVLYYVLSSNKNEINFCYQKQFLELCNIEALSCLVSIDKVFGSEFIVQPLSSQLRCENLETSSVLDVKQKVIYHESITRYIWPYVFSDSQYINYDTACAYEILSKYFNTSDTKVLSLEYQKIQEKINSNVYRVKLIKR